MDEVDRKDVIPYHYVAIQGTRKQYAYNAILP